MDTAHFLQNRSGEKQPAQSRSVEEKHPPLESLTRLGDADSGWAVLYWNPDDDALWEVTFPHGEEHGGGKQVVRPISAADARSKYGADDIPQ